MIAVDTSSLVAYLGEEEGGDVEALDEALAARQVVLPPVVLTEVLSLPGLDPELIRLVSDLPLLDVRPEHWQRAGATRAKILARRLRARLADTLIAQSCLDHQVPLITRDTDFRHFQKHAGLRLI